LCSSTLRTLESKSDRVPLWIPRKDADYVVVTCRECLRSSSIADTAVNAELHETDCLACGATIRYLVLPKCGRVGESAINSFIFAKSCSGV
jgi:hypothetical protein